MPIIRLSDTDTQAFKDPYFIQKDAKDKFEELIQRFIKSSSDKGNDDDCRSQSTCTETARVHNTILINGKRGMGKTSFILSVLDQKADWLNNVCNLCIIDPTMIETKEHIFLNIIARIKERVDEHRKSDHRVSDDCYKAWECSLKKLAGGLSVLDGVGNDPLKDDLWDSPELILEKGLDNSKHGWKLERHFHVFLEESLKLLEKKVFLLVLDDIDTSLREGKAILEILRKYLTSKKLIIVMLGDIDLYATIVRQLQWEKMDPNGTLHKYEQKNSEIKEFYRSQIEHLEEQYLTKLLKPENRIKLKTIMELKSYIKVLRIDGKNQAVSEFMRVLVEEVFLRSRYSKLYEQTLLVQSTRSVVQVMKGWDENPDRDLETFVEVLRQVFFTTLKKNLEPFDLLYTTKDRNLLNRLALYMLKKDIHRDSHMKLLPEYRDDDKNITMLFLNAEINAQLKPQQYLSYLIKVGYALDRFGSLGDSKNLEKFIDHVGLDSNISNAHIARRLLSTFKIDYNRPKPVFLGNLFFPREDKGGMIEKNKLALFMSYVISPKGKNYMYISLFNLLGILADVSALVEDSVENEWKIECERVLKECKPIRGIHSYHTDAVGGSVYDNSSEQYDISEFDIDNELINDIVAWGSKAFDITQMLSMTDLANIWIRFSYSISEIDSRSENISKNYAEMLDLYIAAFLNAVYVCCEGKKGKKIDITNPSTDTRHFYKKLGEYESSCDENTLFDYLRACPVLTQGFVDLLTDLKDISQTNRGAGAKRRRKVLELSLFDDVKKDFRKLSEFEQISAIQLIDGWGLYAPSTIGRKLRQLGYKYVPDNNTLKELIIKAKGV